MSGETLRLIAQCMVIGVLVAYAAFAILPCFKPHWFFKPSPPITEVEPKALALAQSYMGDQWEDIPGAVKATMDIINPLRDVRVRRDNIHAVILSTWIRGYQAGRDACGTLPRKV